MKKWITVSLLSTLLLAGCGQTIEEEAYEINQGLIAENFPVPDSLKFPKFKEEYVSCLDDMCSVIGSVKYENRYGVKVEGDYESLLTYDEDYFHLVDIEIYER